MNTWLSPLRTNYDLMSYAACTPEAPTKNSAFELGNRLCFFLSLSISRNVNLQCLVIHHFSKKKKSPTLSIHPRQDRAKTSKSAPAASWPPSYLQHRPCGSLAARGEKPGPPRGWRDPSRAWRSVPSSRSPAAEGSAKVVAWKTSPGVAKPGWNLMKMKGKISLPSVGLVGFVVELTTLTEPPQRRASAAADRRALPSTPARNWKRSGRSSRSFPLAPPSPFAARGSLGICSAGTSQNQKNRVSHCGGWTNRKSLNRKFTNRANNRNT